MADEVEKKSFAQQLAPQMYKATTDNITFSKRQQWTITNYTALVYAGLVGLKKSFTGGASQCELAILTILAVSTGVGAWFPLWRIQHDMGRFRARLESIHNEFLTKQERDAMHIVSYGSEPWRRAMSFYRALIVVIGIGCLLVVWALCRS